MGWRKKKAEELGVCMKCETLKEQLRLLRKSEYNLRMRLRSQDDYIKELLAKDDAA